MITCFIICVSEYLNRFTNKVVSECILLQIKNTLEHFCFSLSVWADSSPATGWHLTFFSYSGVGGVSRPDKTFWHWTWLLGPALCALWGAKVGHPPADWLVSGCAGQVFGDAGFDRLLGHRAGVVEGIVDVGLVGQLPWALVFSWSG